MSWKRRGGKVQRAKYKGLGKREKRIVIIVKIIFVRGGR